MKFAAIIYLATASTSFAAQTLLKTEVWSGTETCTGTAASKRFYQFDRCKVAHGTVHSIWTSTGNTITTKSYILDTNCTGTASSTTDYTSGTCQNSTTAGNISAMHSIDSTTMPDSLVAITTIALLYMTSTTCSGDYTCPPATNGSVCKPYRNSWSKQYHSSNTGKYLTLTFSEEACRAGDWSSASEAALDTCITAGTASLMTVSGDTCPTILTSAAPTMAPSAPTTSPTSFFSSAPTANPTKYPGSASSTGAATVALAAAGIVTAMLATAG